MYQVEAWSALRRARRDAGDGLPWLHVRRNVWALGFTSLFTDVSSEMVGTVLPVYLVLYLGLTPFQFGIVDGALPRGDGAAAAGERRGRRPRRPREGDRVRRLWNVRRVPAGTAGGRRLVAAHRRGGGGRPGRQGRPRRAARRADLAQQPSERSGDRVRRPPRPRQRRRHARTAGCPRHSRRAPERLDVVFVTSFSVAVVGLGVLALFVTNADRPRAPTPAPRARSVTRPAAARRSTADLLPLRSLPLRRAPPRCLRPRNTPPLQPPPLAASWRTPACCASRSRRACSEPSRSATASSTCCCSGRPASVRACFRCST